MRVCVCVCEHVLADLMFFCFGSFAKESVYIERLKDGNVHMCFSSRSGYRPFITPPRALGN